MLTSFDRTHLPEHPRSSLVLGWDISDIKKKIKISDDSFHRRAHDRLTIALIMYRITSEERHPANAVPTARLALLQVRSLGLEGSPWSRPITPSDANGPVTEYRNLETRIEQFASPARAQAITGWLTALRPRMLQTGQLAAATSGGSNVVREDVGRPNLPCCPCPSPVLVTYIPLTRGNKGPPEGHRFPSLSSTASGKAKKPGRPYSFGRVNSSRQTVCYALGRSRERKWRTSPREAFSHPKHIDPPFRCYIGEH